MIIGQGYRLVVNDRNQFVRSLSEYTNIRLHNRSALSATEREIIRDSILDVHKQKFDAAKILKMCSPQVEANVFLSHSHNDLDNNSDGLNIVEPLVAMLEDKTGYKVFVDSWYWRDYRKILNELWKITSKNNNSLANAEWLSSNTHCMLLKSLAEMIHKCDFFVFLDSSNSTNANRTPSPWLFCELAFSQLLQRDKKMIKEGKENFSEVDRPSFQFKADINHLKVYSQDKTQTLATEILVKGHISASSTKNFLQAIKSL